MATTGELRAIIEELQLVDIGEAASYLGEEEVSAQESNVTSETVLPSILLPLPDASCICIYCNW